MRVGFRISILTFHALCLHLQPNLKIMNFRRHSNSFRESHIDTLGKIYEYSTRRYAKNRMSKPPVPALLLKAMQVVKPTTILSVPLIIEKIYRNSIVPTIRKSRMLSWMDKNMNWLMCKVIGLKLKKTFGGHLSFFGIGGAKLDIEAERFLLKAGFPYAVGYGLTETSPLLSFTAGRSRLPGSIGTPVHNVELRLDNINPETGEDEFFRKIKEYKSMILNIVNKNVNRTSKVSAVQILREPFEKTATRKIRRFKYFDVKGI